jgi:hypothetical protein
LDAKLNDKLYSKEMKQNPSDEAPPSGFLEKWIWLAPKLFKRPKGGFQGGTIEEEESWGTFPNLQHFGGGRAC